MWIYVQAALAYLLQSLKDLVFPTLSLPPSLPTAVSLPSFKDMFNALSGPGPNPFVRMKEWLRKYRGPVACLLSTLLAFAVFVYSLVLQFRSSSPLRSLTTQLMLAATTISLVPTLLLRVDREKHRWAVGTIEALAYFLTIVLLAAWRGHPIWNAWIGYGGLLVALIVAGGHLVEWYRDEILTRVRNDTTSAILKEKRKNGRGGPSRRG